MDEDGALKKARYLVLRLLTYRARSRKEISEYLMRKGFDQDILETVISEMEGYGYIDDKRFTDDFIAVRKARGEGIKKIRHELTLKGIDSRLIDQKVAANFDPEEDLERIKKLIERRNNKGSGAAEGKFDERWLRRQAAFLKRRGFQDHLILRALKEYGAIE